MLMLNSRFNVHCSSSSIWYFYLHCSIECCNPDGDQCNQCSRDSRISRGVCRNHWSDWVARVCCDKCTNTDWKYSSKYV